MLDEFDLRILRRIQVAGRESIAALSEHVGLSESPCQRRLRGLEQGGWITGYKAVVDRKKLGLTTRCFVLVSISPHGKADEERFQSVVSSIPNVLACYAIAGEFDFLLDVVVSGTDEYSQVINNALLGLPNVLKIHSLFTVKEVKPSSPIPC